MKFRLRRCAAGCLAAALAVSLLAVAQADSGTAEEAIRTAYTALQAALFKNDASAIAPLLATNFQARQVDGSIQDCNAPLARNLSCTNPRYGIPRRVKDHDSGLAPC